MSQAAKDVEASQDALIDLFERMENFFKRLESHTAVPPTDAMTDIIVKIMIEVLNIFAIATKEIRQGRASALLLMIYNCQLSANRCILHRKISEEAYWEERDGRCSSTIG